MSYTAFSGGADSTALALMNKDSIPVFTDTGWEFPQLYEHIDKFEAVTGRKVTRIKSAYPGGLPGYIRDYLYFPNHGARFCTRVFKIQPFEDFFKNTEDKELLIGLRADEPDRVGNLSKGINVRYPFRELHMVRDDIVAVCEHFGLKPAYPPFMLRGGCVGCFYKRKGEVVAMYHLAPDVYWKLADLEEEVQDERGDYFHMFSSVGMGLRKFATQIAAQSLMFSLDDLYQVSLDTAPCGVFCNR